MQCEPPAPWRSPPPQAEHETEHRRMVVVNSEILAQRVPFSSRQWAASQRNTLAPDIVFYRPDRPVIATRLTISFRQASQWRGGRKAPTAPPGISIRGCVLSTLTPSPLQPPSSARRAFQIFAAGLDRLQRVVVEMKPPARQAAKEHYETLCTHGDCF